MKVRIYIADEDGILLAEIELTVDELLRSRESVIGSAAVLGMLLDAAGL